MKTETEKELDIFCAEKVMKWKRVETCGEFTAGNFLIQADGSLMAYDSPSRFFSPTSSPADAVAVLKECCHKKGCHPTTKLYGGPTPWHIVSVSVEVKAATWELAICQFAKQLFSK